MQPCSRVHRGLPRAPARAWLWLVALVAVPSGGRADEVLHERVTVTPLGPRGGRGGADRGGEAVLTPEAGGDGVDSATGEAATGAGVPERALRMDRDTGPEPPGQRVYHEIFTPAVFPFQRMIALDAVAADETLTLSPRARERREQAVLGRLGRDPGPRDAFWGSILVELEPDAWIPLPSPAPDLHILSYRADPAPGAPLAFYRDGADNYYVRAHARGRVRLTWLVDALKAYFGDADSAAALGRDQALVGDEPAALVPRVPELVRRRAAQVWARIGVTPSPHARLGSTLTALVQYFRGFTVGPMAVSSGSTYLDLALARKGSCRHRSYAFVITALAGGIPARYVENELHVFVEVYLPRFGWQRIDLGGAPVEQRLVGADGKPAYQRGQPDPFPRPSGFRDSSAVAVAGGRAGTGGGGNGAGGNGAGGNGSHKNISDESISDENGSFESDPGGPGAGPGGAAASFPDGKPVRSSDERYAAERRRTRPAVAEVTLEQHDGFRGEAVEIAGRLTRGARASLAGRTVDIYLEGGGAMRRVATTVADADGRFRARFEVPREEPLGEHRVVAVPAPDEDPALPAPRP